MKIKRATLINDLIQRTQYCVAEAQKLVELPDKRLLQQPKPEAWNALQCLEHLSYYTQFYHPEFNRKIKSAPDANVIVFKSGWLGGYFARKMKPEAPRMNTINKFDPSKQSSQANRDIINRFLQDQQEMFEILSRAKCKDLNAIRSGISLFPVIKLKLGDALRIVVYHNQRHVQQALKAAKLRE